MRLKNYPKTYQTERLLLRPLDLADVNPWADFLAHPKANALFPKFLTENTREQSMLWIERQICRYRDLQGGLLAIIDKKSGEFMGQSGLLVQEVDGKKDLEVGYHLHPKFWGNGYASETANFFKTLGFQISEVNSIISIIDVRNENSKKVAHRNGMEVSKTTIWKGLNVEIFRIQRP